MIKGGLVNMNQHEAAEKQLAAYRRMTPEQRLEIALGLHELACDMAREGIRWQHPEASPATSNNY